MKEKLSFIVTQEEKFVNQKNASFACKKSEFMIK